MKNYLILALLVFWSGPGFCQSKWQATAPFSKADNFATNSFSVSPVSGAIFVSTEEEGLQRSTDQGSTWTKVLSESVYTVKVHADGTVFAGGVGTMYISADGGQTWVASAIPSSYPVSTMAFNQQGHIFVGTSNLVETSSGGSSGDGVFTSTDNGQSWHSLNTGIATSLNITVLAIDANDRLYLGTSENEKEVTGGFYTMAANEQIWTRIPVDVADLKDIRINYFYMLGLDRNNNLYISVEGSYNRIGAKRTLKSVDNGATWQIIALRESPNGIYYDDVYLQSFFLSKNGLLWTSIPARLGIYFSDDDGQNWKQHMTGMSSSYNIVDFAEATDGKFYALKRYDSNIIFTMEKPLDATEPAVENTIALKSYPNPFSEKLNLRCTLVKPATIQVTIVDALGRKVFSEQQRFIAGTHTINWKPANVAAGLYVVQVQTDQEKQMQKVIYLR